jgi:hypothetical protein
VPPPRTPGRPPSLQGVETSIPAQRDGAIARSIAGQSAVLLKNSHGLLPLRAVHSVAAANPKTVVVLKTGGPVLMPWLAQVPAVLEAWYPGEEDGNVVADLLFGDANPSGKLPMTFPKAESQTPANTPDPRLRAAMGALRRAADAELTAGPWSVMDKSTTVSPDKHDYYSLATYWWPSRPRA